ncbi:MAG: hypothetical protein OEV66_12650 [Spirochaetia bacterium]|nr:hypothetical protein [Spirochaetia bacterium]
METNENISAQEKWVKLIGQWKESGLSQAEFCRQHNFDRRYFSKWKSKLEQGKNETPFLEIPLNVPRISHRYDLNIGLNVRANGEIVISIRR